MPAISKNNELTTVIIIFPVEPSQQQELIDNILDFLEKTVRHQPGFISASIHKSIDGERVANYAQWKTLKDYAAFLQNNDVQSKAPKIFETHPPDSKIYEISISKPDNKTPKIAKGGHLTHFGVFILKPENQQRMLDLARQEVEKAMENPGLISTTFHRSLDGTRVINYGQWRSQADFEALLKKPGFGTEKPYWEGIAENEFHLYEVVFTQPA